jgi:hypothetical protein
MIDTKPEFHGKNRKEIKHLLQSKGMFQVLAVINRYETNVKRSLKEACISAVQYSLGTYSVFADSTGKYGQKALEQLMERFEHLASPETSEFAKQLVLKDTASLEYPTFSSLQFSKSGELKGWGLKKKDYKENLLQNYQFDLDIRRSQEGLVPMQPQVKSITNLQTQNPVDVREAGRATRVPSSRVEHRRIFEEPTAAATKDQEERSPDRRNEPSGGDEGRLARVVEAFPRHSIQDIKGIDDLGARSGGTGNHPEDVGDSRPGKQQGPVQPGHHPMEERPVARSEWSSGHFITDLSDYCKTLSSAPLQSRPVQSRPVQPSPVSGLSPVPPLLIKGSAAETGPSTLLPNEVVMRVLTTERISGITSHELSSVISREHEALQKRQEERRFHEYISAGQLPNQGDRRSVLVTEGTSQAGRAANRELEVDAERMRKVALDQYLDTQIEKLSPPRQTIEAIGGSNMFASLLSQTESGKKAKPVSDSKLFFKEIEQFEKHQKPMFSLEELLSQKPEEIKLKHPVERALFETKVSEHLPTTVVQTMPVHKKKTGIDEVYDQRRGEVIRQLDEDMYMFKKQQACLLETVRLAKGPETLRKEPTIALLASANLNTTGSKQSVAPLKVNASKEAFKMPGQTVNRSLLSAFQFGAPEQVPAQSHHVSLSNSRTRTANLCSLRLDAT